MDKTVDERYKVDPKKASKEETDRAFALLAKEKERKDKIAKGEIKGGRNYAEMTPDQRAKQKKYNYRRLIRQTLLLAKATAAGLVVSDKEVDAEVAKRSKK
jgi:hypothetical protein